MKLDSSDPELGSEISFVPESELDVISDSRLDFVPETQPFAASDDDEPAIVLEDQQSDCSEESVCVDESSQPSQPLATSEQEYFLESSESEETTDTCQLRSKTLLTGYFDKTIKRFDKLSRLLRRTELTRHAHSIITSLKHQNLRFIHKHNTLFQNETSEELFSKCLRVKLVEDGREQFDLIVLNTVCLNQNNHDEQPAECRNQIPAFNSKISILLQRRISLSLELLRANSIISIYPDWQLHCDPSSGEYFIANAFNLQIE